MPRLAYAALPPDVLLGGFAEEIYDGLLTLYPFKGGGTGGAEVDGKNALPGGAGDDLTVAGTGTVGTGQGQVQPEALELNGTNNQYLQHASQLSIAGGSFAVMFWLYFDALPSADAYIVSRDGAGSDRGWWVVLAADGKPRAGLSTDGTAIIEAEWATPLAAGQYHQLLMQFNIDAELLSIAILTPGQTLTTVSRTIPSGTWNDGSAERFLVGARDFSSPSDFFTGRIDQLLVWSRTVSESEARFIYNLGAGRLL